MIPAGWATEFVFQSEAVPLGTPTGRVFAGFHSVSATLDAKHAATISTISPSRKLSNRQLFFPSYELSLEFMMHQTTSTLKLLGMMFNQTSRITFGGYDVRTFDSSSEDEIETATFWLSGPEFDGRVLRVRGAAVQSIAVSTPKTRGSVRLSVKLVALACDYVNSMPGYNPEPPGAGLVNTLKSNAYFTEGNFTDDLTGFAIPQITSLSAKLSRQIEPARYGRDGYPTRLHCTKRADIQASLGLRAVTENVENWIRWRTEGASILKFGDTEQYRFEILIPKCILTAERLPIQSSASEIARTVTMYAIQDMGQTSSAILRTIRGYSDAMYYGLTFFGDLIADQIFGAYEAPFEVIVSGVQWSLQNACVGSNGSMRLVNGDGVEVGDLIEFTAGEKKGQVIFYSPITLLQGETLRGKITSLGSGESGAGLTANLIIQTA